MSYDDSSLKGDEICDYYYDLENNFMNPPSPLGFFIYKIVGGAFDRLDEVINQFRIDLSIFECNVGQIEIVNTFPTDSNPNHVYYVPNYSTTGVSYTRYEYIEGSWVSTSVETKVLNSLDNFWGKSYQLPRPSVSYVTNGVVYSRKLTDKEYKVYLYLREHRLITKADLLNAFNNAFGDDENNVELVTTSLDVNKVVNHKEYDNPPFSNDSLGSIDSSDMSIVTDKLEDEDVNIVTDYLTIGDTFIVVVPNNSWDPIFLAFLEQYTSVKGNVLISEEG